MEQEMEMVRIDKIDDVKKPRRQTPLRRALAV